MSRPSTKVKTSKVLPERAEAKAANPPGSATSPKILPLAWASASHRWRVANASRGPRLQVLCQEAMKSDASAPVAIGQRSRFTVSLLRGGAAERAGVCKGDLLVWMNGATVSDLTHAALKRMVGSQTQQPRF